MLSSLRKECYKTLGAHRLIGSLDRGMAIGGMAMASHDTFEAPGGLHGGTYQPSQERNETRKISRNSIIETSMSIKFFL